jgi:hypothetical protein
MALSAELMLAARCGYIALRGSRDVLALRLDGADRRRHDHQPNQQGARRLAAVPRLVGSHCRQSNFRCTVGVAKLSLNVRSSVLVWLAAIARRFARTRGLRSDG